MVKNKFISGRNLTDINKIEKLYTSGQHNVSFSGRNALHRFFKKKTPTELNDMLFSIDTYTRHQPSKKPSAYNVIYSRKKRKNFQGDILELVKLAPWNNGIKYLLLIVDTFSRRLWMEPLKTKTMHENKNKLEKIFKSMGGNIEHDAVMCYDYGTEVVNSEVKEYLKKIKVKLIHSSTNKCVIIERLVLSVKRLIMAYITQNESRKYIHALKNFENVINNRFHRMINMSPLEAEKPKNRNKVIEFSQRRYDRVFDKRKKKPKYKVGDKVRFSNTRGIYSRGFDEEFNIEVCRIKSVLTNMPIVMYELYEYDGKTEIKGKWYESELTPWKGSTFKVEEVLKTRKRKGVQEYLVKWLGYPNSYNSYITKDKITKDTFERYASSKRKQK